MAGERRLVTEPEITGNARLALGYIAGKLHGSLFRQMPVADDSFFDLELNAIEIEHSRTGNRYRISVVQIGGVE